MLKTKAASKPCAYLAQLWR